MNFKPYLMPVLYEHCALQMFANVCKFILWERCFFGMFRLRAQSVGAISPTPSVSLDCCHNGLGVDGMQPPSMHRVLVLPCFVEPVPYMLKVLASSSTAAMA